MTRRDLLTEQPKRTRPNCDCGGPCFYCERPLARGHDHVPLPWRRGGRLTVPTCKDCHNMKDRVPVADWPVEAFIRAMDGCTTPEARIFLAKMCAHAADAQAQVRELQARASS